jgi:hypothetical protein|tara:strand:+ start:669 stop:1850 length:1182 start_codon:yes stop_codon:yes gene_type:complete
MKSSKIKHIISISSLTFYLILAGGSTEDTTSSLVKNETPKLMDEDYPLNIKVNEYIEDENKLSIYVITQNTSEEKVEFNLYAIKLTGEDGSEVGPDIMDTRAPSFPVNKSLNKGDKASGWLNFEIPSSSFRPEKLEFQKLMSSDNYGVLDVKGMLAGKDVGDKFEEITISSTQGSVPDYPLNSTIKDLNQNETNFRIYIVTENTSEEKVEFNLYAIKLVGEDGSELGVDLFDNQEPSFPVNKSLNKGDKAAGWLSFEIPSSSFKPKKLEFRKLMSSDMYDVIRMDSDEAVVKKKSIEKKRLEEEAESRNGTYTGRDRSSGSTLELTLTLSGNSWSMKTVPFSVDYGYNTQPTAIYDRGIVKGDDLYDESGSFKLGYVSSGGSVNFNNVTLRKR